MWPLSRRDRPKQFLSLVSDNTLIEDTYARVAPLVDSSRIYVVAEEDSMVDLKSLHQRIGASGRLSFVDAGRMREALGVEPGSVTAFALLNDEARQVSLVLDAALAAHDMVNCHPLTNTATTTIRRDDLLRFFAATGHEPRVADLGGPAGIEASPETAGETQGGLK